MKRGNISRAMVLTGLCLLLKINNPGIIITNAAALSFDNSARKKQSPAPNRLPVEARRLLRINKKADNKDQNRLNISSCPFTLATTSVWTGWAIKSKVENNAKICLLFFDTGTSMHINNLKIRQARTIYQIMLDR